MEPNKSSKKVYGCIFALTNKKTNKTKTELAEVALFTPSARRPGAAAGPAPLALQSGLAQESVVVRGSPGALPGDPGHADTFPNRQVHGALVITARIKWQSSPPPPDSPRAESEQNFPGEFLPSRSKCRCSSSRSHPLHCRHRALPTPTFCSTKFPRSRRHDVREYCECVS